MHPSLAVAVAKFSKGLNCDRTAVLLNPMKTRSVVCSLLLLVLCGPGKDLSAQGAEALNLYVATNGNNTWSGKLPAPNAARTDGPFAGLERARDEIRKLKAAGALTAPVTIQVRGGLYALAQMLTLGAQDAGTAAAPVVYRAYQNEKPTLIGGKQVTGFIPHKGRILKADVAAQGMKGVYFRQLIFAGKRQHLARYPNYDAKNPYGGGWTYVDGEYIPMYKDIPGESRRSLHYKAADFHNWARPEEGEVFVFARYNWWNNIVRIASIDQAKRIMTLAGDASYPIRPTDRYYLRNLFEELDAPGEWYLDKQTWTLYFWPPSPLAGKAVYAPTMRTILAMGQGTAHVTFQGFTFECAEGTAIALNNTTNCRIAACTIRNVGDYNGSGVSISGGAKNGVAGCDIYEIGSHGVSLSGGNRKTLTPAENYADNNYIHHIGVFYKQGVGVSMSGVGNRASHNLIHDGPRMGIMFSGNNLILEYNHIRHMNLETSDTGAVYTGGRDWISSRGTVIRYNYFHDILGYGYEHGKWQSPFFAWGVYLDDNTGGVDVIGNIVTRTPRAGIHLHNGRDNLVANNVFADSSLQQIECNGWTRTHSYWTNHLPTMIQGYDMVAKEPAWRNMRNMNLHPTNAVLPDNTIMSGNQFFRNIIAYRDPKAKYTGLRTFSLEHNQFDSNLVWHAGQPVRTGQVRAGKDLSANLAPNSGFEQGAPGGMPQDWQWQIRPRPDAKAGLVESGAASGRRAMRIDAAFATEKPRDNYPIVVSKDLALQPGHSYRIKARMKASKADAQAALMLQWYLAKVGFWANSPNAAKVGTTWKDYEFAFRIPGPGDSNYKPEMKLFRLRVDFPDKSGSLWVDDVSLTEIEMLDEWASWQALGQDRHSVVADPLFVNADKDDYRLKPNSPAFKLGFQPIPVEKIGPYKDPLRASWPIVEAEGAREHPLVSEAH